MLATLHNTSVFTRYNTETITEHRFLPRTKSIYL